VLRLDRTAGLDPAGDKPEVDPKKEVILVLLQSPIQPDMGKRSPYRPLISRRIASCCSSPTWAIASGWTAW